MSDRSDTPNAGGKSGPSVGARSGPPAELVPDVSTNMYVVNKIGELTSAVSFLTESVRDQVVKLERLQTKANRVEGGLIVGAFFMSGIAGLVYWALSAKWDEALKMLKAIEPLLPK